MSDQKRIDIDVDEPTLLGRLINLVQVANSRESSFPVIWEILAGICCIVGLCFAYIYCYEDPVLWVLVSLVVLAAGVLICQVGLMWWLMDQDG